MGVRATTSDDNRPVRQTDTTSSQLTYSTLHLQRPTQADISLLSLFCASHHRSSSFTSFYYNTLFIVVLTHLTRSTHLIPAHFASVCLSCPVCLYSAARARLYLCSSSVSLFSSLAFSIRNNNLVQQPGNHLIRSSKHLPSCRFSNFRLRPVHHPLLNTQRPSHLSRLQAIHSLPIIN